MSNPRKRRGPRPGRRTDPRRLAGAIAGPGGSHTADGVVIDTRRALFPETTYVAEFGIELRPGLRMPLAALELEGRVLNTGEPGTPRARILVALTSDVAAAIVTELVGLASRDIAMRQRDGLDVADGFGAHFRVALDERHAAMPDPDDPSAEQGEH